MSTILSTLGRIASEFSAARTRYRTERAIRALPLELQKDIGWPEAEDVGSRFSMRIGNRASA